MLKRIRSVVHGIPLLVILLAIGCGGVASSEEDGTATARDMPEPTIEIMPTAMSEAALPEAAIEPKIGAPRQIPAILTQPENATLGATLTQWQAYIENGAMSLPGETWHLCKSGSVFDGFADGDLLNGGRVANVRWSIAPPTPALQPNEVYLVVTDDAGKSNQTFVLSYLNGSPLAVPEPEHNPGGGELEIVAAGPLEFSVSESLVCAVSVDELRGLGS